MRATLEPSNAALCTHIFANLTQDFRAQHLSLFYVKRPRATKPQITVPLSVWHLISCECLGMKLMQGGVGGCPASGGSKWYIRYSVRYLRTLQVYGIRNTSSAEGPPDKIETVSSCLISLNNWHRCLPTLQYTTVRPP